ncbi:hypothetical protein VIGAN_01077300 [Vigna angularis var. angularis]|uniref:Uncharacterized protein n=1 Tax=Vigna angularis var. angularis TaxID=157739 RepID=A0A0S3QY96_PHAAN|nr:hypothetical protein VIGAN_01077300 [Vigna angularis var. angularis]
MAKTRGSWLLKNRIPSRYRTPSHTHLHLTRYSLTLILTLLLFFVSFSSPSFQSHLLFRPDCRPRNHFDRSSGAEEARWSVWRRAFHDRQKESVSTSRAKKRRQRRRGRQWFRWGLRSKRRGIGGGSDRWEGSVGKTMAWCLFVHEKVGVSVLC